MSAQAGEWIYKTDTFRALDDATARFARALILSATLFMTLVLIPTHNTTQFIVYSLISLFIGIWLFLQFIATYSALRHAFRLLLGAGENKIICDLVDIVILGVCISLFMVLSLIGLQAGSELQNFMQAGQGSP